MLGKSRYKSQKRFRVSNWDYSENGYYFVTICTKNHENYFGEIIDSKMYLSEIGKIVRVYWLEIPKHFKDVFLDEWIIMPNHVHGIIVINHDYINNYTVGTGQCPVPTKKPKFSKFGKVISGSLSTIIGCFKTAVTKHCKNNYYKNFSWQNRFYDHIIRSDKSLYNIREYIKNNPQKWETDRNNPENLFL